MTGNVGQDAPVSVQFQGQGGTLSEQLHKAKVRLHFVDLINSEGLVVCLINQEATSVLSRTSVDNRSTYAVFGNITSYRGRGNTYIYGITFTGNFTFIILLLRAF
jgi:hypothetical protein